MTPTSLPAYFFTFLLFFGGILFAATVILVWLRFRDDHYYRKDRFIRLFGFVGLFALLTQWCYIDAPKRIFSNADHHLIEHLGFSFGQQLILADPQQPQTALWDNRSGSLRVAYQSESAKFTLQGRNYTEPVYTQTNSAQYTLQNSLINRTIREEFTIRFDSIAVRFRLQFHPDSLSSFVVLHPNRPYGPFRVPIPMPLQKGYSLGGMIGKARADAPDLGALTTALDSVYLLRTVIGKDVAVADQKSVVLFPSTRLLQTATELTIDGQSVPLPIQPVFTVTLAPQQTFFMGLWSDQGKRYQLRRNSLGGSEWLINFPQKEYLKRTDDEKVTSLFLTSSAGEVANSEQAAGFYYPLFDRADNLNHVSANIAYHAGSTREAMQFRVINYDQNDLPANAIQTLGVGDTLRLQTRGMSTGQTDTQWLFRFRNLKADNPLQLWHMLALTLLLIGAIYGCIYVTPNEQQTKAEYIAYLLLLALMTLRSVLLWRVSTFLPVDDITPKVYEQLAGLGWSYFWKGGGLCLAFFGAVILWKRTGHRLLVRQNTPTAPVVFRPALLVWFGLYVLALLVKFGGAFISELERLGAIFLPIVAYFTISFVLLQTLTRSGRRINDPSYVWLTRLNWLCCLVYLALADAGFSIIFLVGTLIYSMVSYLTFPRSGLGNQLMYRLLLASGVAVGLILFIGLAPWILSQLFQHTQFVLFGLAGLSLVVAIRAWFQKQTLIVFDRPVSKWVIPVVCVVMAVGLVGLREPISQKVQDKSYARYRSEVLFRTPDEIIQEGKFQFNAGADSELLRAAQNQWFINYFYQKSSLNPQHPFRILPSFQKGSPYMTQICDLVTVRYVIGEHSQFLITFLLSLMALLLLAATDADTRYNVFSMVRVKLLCLLFAIGFFVWMAATNRIVFLGQDFPILSLNSVLTFLVTLFILFATIVLGDYANVSANSLRFHSAGQQQAPYFMRGLVLVTLFGLLFIRQHDFSEERFNLDQTISNLQTSFDDLNQSFRLFQNDLDSTQRDKPPGQLVQQFDASTYAPRNDAARFQNNPFALSAYEAYRNVLMQNNSPANLIHLRRRNDDTYEFAVNKLFYSVNSPDQMLNAWRGHLLAEPKNETVSFVNRRTNRSLRLNPHRANFYLLDTLHRLLDGQAGTNLRMTNLPAGWTLDSLPLLLISRTSGDQRTNRSSFVVKNGPDMFRSANSNFAVVLHPNDVLQFVPYGEEQPVTVQYQHRTRQYLARNVWLNGHQQFFYPLGSKFLWPYHFASLVKSKYDQDEDARGQNVSLSLDPQLTEQIYDLAATYFQRDKWKKEPRFEAARAFNLVVLGSDGKLRALCDYQKGATVRIDPNRIGSYRNLFSQLYLDTQIDQERLMFGNRCLMRMDNGPASTFKPILYSAVTSQYHFDWETLKFDGIQSAYQEALVKAGTNRDFTIRRFGGRPITFAVDESNLRPHAIDEYISLSTNTYNSMIVYLGSLNRNQIMAEHNYVRGLTSAGAYLARGYSEKASDNFPILNIGGAPYHIRSLNVAWDNTQSLMGLGLWNNFNLPVQERQVAGQARSWQNLALSLDSTRFNESQSSNKIWSFPEPSHFYLIDRKDPDPAGRSIHNAIVQCATGSDPISTTPYKMAEMAASLFSFNRAFQSSVLANAPLHYVPFRSDQSWGDTRQLTRFYSQTLFRAMHQSTVTGTARKALGEPATYPAEFRGYHFYAKTGTNSGNRDGGKRDKHLMLIISRDQLEDRDLTPENLRNNRFMVLYFSFYKQSRGAEWGSADDQELLPTLREMIKTVIKSEPFTALMRNETNR